MREAEKLIKRGVAAKSFSTPSTCWHKNALAAHEQQHTNTDKHTNIHINTQTYRHIYTYKCTATPTVLVQSQINNKKSSNCRPNRTWAIAAVLALCVHSEKLCKLCLSISFKFKFKLAFKCETKCKTVT